MSREKFTEKLVSCLKEILSEDVEVTSTNVIKNNDTKLSGICIKRANSQIGKNIYVDKYYQDYLDGTAVEKIVAEVIDIANNDDSLPQRYMEVVGDIASYENIKELLAVKIISRERNKNYLKDKCFIDYLDFAICFYINIAETGGCSASISVTKHISELWNQSSDILLNQALDNMKKYYKPEIVSIWSLINKMIEIHEEMPDGIDSPMFVISNECRNNGASSILYTEMLHSFAIEQKTEKIFIIPSSIHECILIPATAEFNADMLCEMVREVNRTQVSSDEILSDHIYIYSLISDEIAIYKKEEKLNED